VPTKPEPSASPVGAAEDALLEVRDLKVHYALRGGALDRLTGRNTGAVKAVDGVSFSLNAGEVLGVVGESGSGKTTLGRAIVGMAPVTGGSLSFEGDDLLSLKGPQRRAARRRLQMVFQDPHASLNPSMDLLTAIGHPLKIHGVTKDETEIRRRVSETLERVGLSPVERFLHKFPADLSGGQKQRAVIARAIILGPALLVADEPVSMLDMSVRAKILQLMMDLRDDLDLAYIYITHDLASAKFFCDRIAIMYLGRIVEIGPPSEIYSNPRHPYTRALLAAIPDPGVRREVPRDLPRGEVPDASAPPAGCSFHPRCPQAFAVCGWESRDLRTLLEDRWSTRSEEVFEQERAVLGDLSVLDRSSYRVAIPAARGRNGDDVNALLETARVDDPAEPLWRGVDRINVGSEVAEVAFHTGVEPALTKSGDVQVACHLYDEYAPLAADDPRFV
jgi:oligopeptide/dipeptide ABC transporter ATP-binding protein